MYCSVDLRGMVVPCFLTHCVTHQIKPQDGGHDSHSMKGLWLSELLPFFVWNSASKSPEKNKSYTIYRMISGKCSVISCYQGKFDYSYLSLFRLEVLPFYPEMSNGGYDGVFILIKHKVFIVCGYVVMCSLLWNIKSLCPSINNPLAAENSPALFLYFPLFRDF